MTLNKLIVPHFVSRKDQTTLSQNITYFRLFAPQLRSNLSPIRKSFVQNGILFTTLNNDSNYNIALDLTLRKHGTYLFAQDNS